MSEDALLLKEIADFLRRRVEIAEETLAYQQEQDRLREKRSAEMSERMLNEVPQTQLSSVLEAEFSDIKQRIDEKSEEYRDDQRIFQERVIETLERQNTILEQISARLKQH